MSTFEKLSRVLALALALPSLFSSRPAAATPEYPEVIDAALETSCPRPNSRCLVCHTTSRGGQGTAMQPFARDLIINYLEDTGNALRGRDSGGLRLAIDLLDDDNDADADGEPDKLELFECGNPSGEDLGIGPEYGCDGAHLGALPQGSSAALLSLLALAGVVVLRRSRRGPEQGRDEGDPVHR